MRLRENGAEHKKHKRKARGTKDPCAVIGARVIRTGVLIADIFRLKLIHPQRFTYFVDRLVISPVMNSCLARVTKCEVRM